MAGRFYNRRLHRDPRMTGALAPGRGRDMRPRSKKPGAGSPSGQLA